MKKCDICNKSKDLEINTFKISKKALSFCMSCEETLRKKFILHSWQMTAIQKQP